MKKYVVPAGWSVVTIMDITSSFGGGTPSKIDPLYWTEGNVPWVSPKDMKSFLVSSSEDSVTIKALEKLTLISKNSVLLVVRSGILTRTLPVSINQVPVTINQDMRAFLPARGINARYLALQLISREREILDQCSKNGTTVASIEGPSLAAFPLSLAPSAEQDRIVEKLEDILSDCDAGVAELKAAQRKLVQYRQSLLKAAVEGALTADWRAARAQSGEPQETGAELLQRILNERRAHWEAKQLSKFAEQGKAPPRDWKAKYPEPAAHVGTKPSNLPNGWTWATVDQISVAQNYGSSAKTNEDGTGIPVLRMGNIQEGELDLGKLKFLPQDHGEFPELFLEDGDILFNRTNSPELVGKTAVFRSEITPCSYASYLIKVRLSNHCSPELVSAYINSVFGRHWVKTVVTQQVGQANVNGSKLAALAVPLPPTDEQVEIARILVEQKKASFRHEAMVNRSLRQSTAQRKNILKAAFAGQLVPQDPNDEPASMLLECIRSERVAADAKRKSKTARKTKERT
ncbi:restriction endonuclease subunit S [Xanthomonas campestris pv. campestris]|nr:restriction endonuclease subunit S [Xanthomonas campestris pv. campestris]